MTFSACINVLLVNIFLVVSGVLCSLFLCVFASLVGQISVFMTGWSLQLSLIFAIMAGFDDY